MPTSPTAITARLRALLEAGARNSAQDAKAIQAIHDGAAMLGAACATPKAEAARWQADTDALLSEADLSFADIIARLTDTIADTMVQRPGQAYPPRPYVVDAFADSCIYSVWDGDDTDLFRQGYTLNADGSVQLNGAPVEVMRQTTYVPVAPDPADAAEAGSDADLTGDIVPLREAAVKTNGTIPVKLIQPGWGSSGYYSAAMLERDGAKAFPAGTHMHLDHPSASEERDRPEGSLKDLGAVLATDAKYNADGVDGPGLYAEAQPFSWARPVIEELAPHIGVSIRAAGRASEGEAEGRRGPIVESLVKGKSVDFVTQAGAGGKILDLYEAARGRAGATGSTQEVGQVTEKEAQELRESVAASRTESARLREALILRDARDFANRELAKIELPDMTRTRLAEALTSNPPVKDGELDSTAFGQTIKEAARAEMEYLAGATGFGSGRITGMGGGLDGGATVTVDEAQQELARSFQGLGLSESGAKIAAGGRR